MPSQRSGPQGRPGLTPQRGWSQVPGGKLCHPPGVKHPVTSWTLSGRACQQVPLGACPARDLVGEGHRASPSWGAQPWGEYVVGRGVGLLSDAGAAGRSSGHPRGARHPREATPVQAFAWALGVSSKHLGLWGLRWAPQVPGRTRSWHSRAACTEGQGRSCPTRPARLDLTQETDGHCPTLGSSVAPTSEHPW